MASMRQPTAAGALLERLHALGVEYIFANSGTDFPPIIEALAEAAARGRPVPRALAVPHEHLAMGMAMGKEVKTDCSINAQIDGKTYCFGNEAAKTEFMKDPQGNLAKARANKKS